MNARAVAILVVLLLVFGGGALVYQRQEAAQRPANAGALGQILLKDLKAAEIAAIRISAPGGALTLQRKDAGWVIAERDGFPADLGKVRELVVNAIGLKVGQSEPIGEKDRSRLTLDKDATRVEFQGGDGKPLATLLVGKKYFRKEVENPEKAQADGRFVMLPGDPKTVYVVSDPLAQASVRTADWIDRTAFKVEKVKTLEVRYPDGSSWRIERSGDNADWRLAGARPGQKLDTPKANAASYSLSLLELADVAPKEAKDTGLDDPTSIDATTLDGLAYAIKVGRRAGDSFYVSFNVSGEPAAAGAEKGEAERLTKLQERLPRERQLASHVLLVPKSKLEDTLKKREELLEKQEPGKK